MDLQPRTTILAALAMATLTVVIVIAVLGAPAADDGATSSLDPTARPSAALPDGTSVVVRDFIFETENVTSPTAQKAQSKLWFAHGTWWAGLLSPNTERITIFRLDWPTQTWHDTGVVVDERPNADPDYLFEGEFLYVASAGTRTTEANAGRVSRFHYDEASQTFVRDPDFPVPITTTGTNAIVIARDSLGVLWVTYVAGGRVMVTHTDGSDARWQPAYPIPGSGQLREEDVSSIVAFGDGRIGVMWSDQQTERILFASRQDGDGDDAWSSVEVVADGAGSSDNHLNLKTFERDGTRVIAAAIKTSKDAVVPVNPLASQILVMFRDADGRWTGVDAGRVQDHHSRPIILIDEERRLLYLLAQSPFNGGSVYLKRTGLDAPSFETGKGEPFIALETDLAIANATSTKQSITAESGLVAMASDDETGRFVHAALDLGGTPLAPQVANLPRPDRPEPVDTPLVLVNDAFDAWLPGATTINGWTHELEPEAAVTVEGTGDLHVLRLSSPAGGAAAETCKELSRIGGPRMLVDVRFRLTAADLETEARLLTVRMRGGDVSGLRAEGDGSFSYFDGTERVRPAVSLSDGRWYRARLDIDVAGRRTDIRLLTDDGQIFAAEGTRWRTDRVEDPSRLCFRVSGGTATLDIDSVVVQR